jgi:hypothetical protein
LVCRGWTVRDSPLLVALQVALPFRVFLPSFFFLLSSSSITPHIHKNKIKNKKKNKKTTKTSNIDTKLKFKKISHKDLKQSYTKREKKKKKQRKMENQRKENEEVPPSPQNNYEREKGGERGRENQEVGRKRVGEEKKKTDQ